MFDIKWIRENAEAFDAGLRRRGHTPLSASLLELDEARRKHVTALQETQARRNAASKEIGKAKAALARMLQRRDRRRVHLTFGVPKIVGRLHIEPRGRTLLEERAKPHGHRRRHRVLLRQYIVERLS